MKCAKRVSQAIRFSRDPGLLAQRAEMLLERNFVQLAHRAARARAELSKPSSKGRANSDEPPLTCLAFACSDFNMTAHAPNVRPIEPQQFARSESGQPPDSHDRAHGTFRRFQQGAKFFRRVEGNFTDVCTFRPHSISF